MSIIELKNITRCVPSESGGIRTVLDNVSFQVEEADILAITGPSGSGKSSILRLMARLDEPSSGCIFFRDKPVDEYPPQELRRKVALTFQSPKLFGPKVFDDLSYPLTIDREKVDIADIRSRAAELIKLTGLDVSFIDRGVDRLSGGETMRVAIARALMRQPEVLLLDEPTAGLDQAAASGLLELITNLNTTRRLTVVIVTHHPEYAALVGRKSIAICEGRVAETRAW